MILIKATTIPDAWFQALYNIFDHGRVYKIDHGSYAGTRRLEYDYAVIRVSSPGIRPLIPSMPEGSTVPPPVADGYVEEYLPYIMTSMKHPNEEYTYGQFLEEQIAHVIDMYRNNGYNTNQATMTIGDQYSIKQNDPPCLRLIDTRIMEGKLNFILYFRSNDLWGGFPANLAALQYLKEYMAGEIGVEDGEMMYASKGLHLYDYVWDIAKIRTGRG